jgi:hypothetical protein
MSYRLEAIRTTFGDIDTEPFQDTIRIGCNMESGTALDRKLALFKHLEADLLVSPSAATVTWTATVGRVTHVNFMALLP